MLIYNQKIEDKTIPLFYDSKCFIPTATSDFLINATRSEFSEKGKVLDLGCGIGVVGISLYKSMTIKQLFSSDLSPEALRYCKINSKKHHIENEIKQGSLFKPWENTKFDLIVNDISGISEEVAKISKWFEFAPCNSGSDGLLLTKKIIEESKEHLTEEGHIVFPIISLCDHERLLDFAKSKFKSLSKISSNNWFLPDELSNINEELLIKLKNENKIYFDQKFGKKICFTDIYVGKF